MSSGVEVFAPAACGPVSPTFLRLPAAPAAGFAPDAPKPLSEEEEPLVEGEEELLVEGDVVFPDDIVTVGDELIVEVAFVRMESW